MFYTPLLHASLRGNLEIVKLLISNGADVNHKNAFGRTALMIAIAQIAYEFDEDGERWEEIIKELLDAGAEPNATDTYDMTALMIAAEDGLTDVVKMLLNAGADKHLENHQGENALSFAIKGNNYRLYEYDMPENTEIITLLQITSSPPAPESPETFGSEDDEINWSPGDPTRLISRDRQMRDQFQAMEDAGVIRMSQSPIPRDMLDRMITPAPAPPAGLSPESRDLFQNNREQFQAMEDAGLINYAPASPPPPPSSPLWSPTSPPSPPSPAPAVWTSANADVATNCSQFRKTINPKCNDQRNCNWEVGVGCRRKRAAAPAPAPNCSQYRKTMNPKCDDQPSCKWVVGSGCKKKRRN